ncbi:MAG: hypothetical protein AB7O31_02035 [Burkholderiales bacterium]
MPSAAMVAIAQCDAQQGRLLQAAVASQGLTAAPVVPEQPLHEALASSLGGGSGPSLVIADLALVCREDGFPAPFCRRVARLRPDTRILLTAGSRAWIGAPERAWVKRAGAADLLPACSAQRARSSIGPVLRQVMLALGGETPDLSRMEASVAALPRDTAAPADAPADRDTLALAGIDLPNLAARMAREGGVPIADRRYLLRTYEQCFVGSEAVDWIAREYAVSRELAALAGSALLDAGYVYHVVREQAFRDGSFYYRFAIDTPALAALDLGALIDAWRAPDGVGIEERSWMGRSYPRCFVGSEAVAWMRARGLSLNEALIVGQRLLDCGVLHHVWDEHGFKEDLLYYRFYADERTSPSET